MDKQTRCVRRARLAGVFPAIAALALFSTPVYPFDPPEPGSPAVKRIDPAVLDGFDNLGGHFEGMDWDKESGFIELAIDNLWQRNGWNDEADRFAHDVLREVAVIPPWKFMRRMEVFNARLASRYGLDENQALEFKGAVMREAGGILMRNMGVIMGQLKEVLETRASQEPFTPEQVALWAEQGRPLLVEVRKSIEQLTSELEPKLSPQKRALLKSDVKSFEKRRAHMDEMALRWVQGEWRPEDWGMGNDPIQHTPPPPPERKPSGTSKPPASASQRSAQVKLPKCVSHDPSSWYVCVLDFEKRFKLDPGQMSTAESVHAELFERANHYVEAYADILNIVPLRERDKHPGYEPIRSLFGEFRSRLDAILTTSQRDFGKEPSTGTDSPRGDAGTTRP